MPIILSIIIPVYNTEEYISKCLRSCIAQDLDSTEYEIIVINDGSTDTSCNIIENIVNYNNNIVVVNKLNGGASSARNSGLDVAQGKYVWFVDADDWIEENCLVKILSIMENERLDALQIGYYTVNNTTIKTCDNKYLTTTTVMTPKEYVKPDLFIGGTWGTIFRREIAETHRIQFDEEMRLGEDQLYFLSILYYSKRVKRENIIIYYYNNNIGSVTNNVSEELILFTIQKISSYIHYKYYEEYCQFIILGLFISLLNIKKNASTLYEMMRKGDILHNYNLKYFNIKNRIILSLSKIIGKPFVSYYYILTNIRKQIKRLIANII